MFRTLLRYLFGSAPSPETPSPPPTPVAEPAADARSAADYQHGVLCRHTLLDRDERVAAYEFLLKQRVVDRLRHVSAATLRLYDKALLSCLVGMDLGHLLDRRWALVPLTPASFEDAMVRQLPRDHVVILIQPREGAPLDWSAAERLMLLTDAGYALAYPVDSLPDLPELPLPAPHLLIADFQRLEVEALQARLSLLRMRWPTAAWAATGLNGEDEFHACFDGRMGVPFELFQGPFVTRREDWHQNHLDPTRSHLLRLLTQLRQDAELAKIAEKLRRDPKLAYKLMRYLGSAASGLTRPPETLEQALILLGRDQLTRWLTLLLYQADGDHGRDLTLLETALARGRLMETLGKPRLGAEHGDALFLTGLFSMLDLVLRQPLHLALAPLNLTPAVIDALLSQHGPYADYLGIALGCETDEAAEEPVLDRVGVSPSELAEASVDAIAWAHAALAA